MTPRRSPAASRARPGSPGASVVLNSRRSSIYVSGMNTPRRNGRLAANLMAIALLVAAQFGAAVHAFEHDLDTPQVKVCGTCVVVSQLGTACAGETPPLELSAAPHVFVTVARTEYASRGLRSPRQRGPPTILA